MKTVIPVAGSGTHIRPHRQTSPRALLPVAGKPLISHITDKFLEAGMKDFVFIVGESSDQIREYIALQYPKINADFVMQASRQGIGHAIWTAGDLLKNEEEIIIALGDIIFETDLGEFQGYKESVIATGTVDDPLDYGVIESNENGWIQKMIEKPDIPKSNQAIVGLYKIKEVKQLLKALDHNVQNNVRTQGEFHLTDALLHLLESGTRIRSLPVENWFNCGNNKGLIHTNKIFLKNPGWVKYRDDYKQTIILPPVYIPSSCKLERTIVGPDVSLGENVEITSSIVRNSIAGPYSAIRNALLDHSVTGSDSYVKGYLRELSLGDRTELYF